MRRRSASWILGAIALALPVGLWFLAWRPAAVDFETPHTVNRVPQIRPDYRDAMFPPNLAPPNFFVDEPGTGYGVRIRAERGAVIEVASRTPKIAIPESKWRQLMNENQGREVHFDICVRDESGRWTRFEPLVNTIADAPIDRYLFYRLMRPIYTVHVKMGIYQRDLQTYKESVVLDVQSVTDTCINCHAFAPNHPDRMALQSRGPTKARHLSGMIVAHDGEVAKVDTRGVACAPEAKRGRIPKAQAAYMRWHPNGKLIAYSANDISQHFHAVGENRDVFDAESDLALYHVDSDTVTTSPQISSADRMETFPEWSPDGRYLYFCSAAPLERTRFREIQYDLMRIAFDPDTGRWGEVEPVLLAKDTGLSIGEPRVSPDGKWLLFCMMEFSSFPAYQPSSDLYLLDVETREYRRLAISAPYSDSWHSWSSNSRWIAFASKREDGVFARIYLSYVDESGHARKPVLLPQRDPTFYDGLIKTYNVPELANTPAPARGRKLAAAIRSYAPSHAENADADAEAESGMQAIEVP